MASAFRAVLFGLILTPTFVLLVPAGPLDDAFVALERRDYATAIRLARPLAEQGHPPHQYRSFPNFA
jgi:hypothetical protein